MSACHDDTTATATALLLIMVWNQKARQQLNWTTTQSAALLIKLQTASAPLYGTTIQETPKPL